MEPIRLWRTNEGDWRKTSGGSFYVTEYAALPRAEYDALVKEREAMKGAIKTTMEAIGTISAERDAAIERAEKAERERDDARAALDAQIATVLAAHLDAPTDDDRPTEADRRGEDGA